MTRPEIKHEPGCPSVSYTFAFWSYPPVKHYHCAYCDASHLKFLGYHQLDPIGAEDAARVDVDYPPVRALQAVGTGVLVGLRYFWRTAAFYGKYNGYYIDTPPRDFSAWQSARIGLGAR